MNSVGFRAKRVVRTRIQHYAAPPAVVFPLHGFREEAAWAVGWQPEFVFPADGAAIEGAVFIVRRAGNEETWVLTRWDPAAGLVGYIHTTAGRDVTDIRIEVTGPETGPTRVVVTYTWTALGPEGNAFVEQQTEEDFDGWMREWEEELAHYLATGRKLERRVGSTPPSDAPRGPLDASEESRGVPASPRGRH